jgi:hypothetical protein
MADGRQGPAREYLSRKNPWQNWFESTGMVGAHSIEPMEKEENEPEACLLFHRLHDRQEKERI